MVLEVRADVELPPQIYRMFEDGWEFLDTGSVVHLTDLPHVKQSQRGGWRGALLIMTRARRNEDPNQPCQS
jgi:hypothetical protein